MNTAVLFSTGKDNWTTPRDLFARLDAEFRFEVDVAATEETRLCGEYFGPDHLSILLRDALTVDWKAKQDFSAFYCNPPYSRGLQGKFIAKAATERLRGVTTVMLLPARTDTRAFHDHIWDAATNHPRTGIEVRFLRGRLKFGGATAGAPFPSCIVVFRGER